MNNVVDEVLNGEPRYRISDANGNIILDNISIEMITDIITLGSLLNKALFDSIKNDLDTRLLISSKATQAEAEAGTDDTKYTTPLKVLQSINKNALPSKHISIKTGTVSNNGTIPQTADYSNYAYFVTPNTISSTKLRTTSNLTSMKIVCEVNQATRKVTVGAYGYEGSSSWSDFTAGTANYLEIAWN